LRLRFGDVFLRLRLRRPNNALSAIVGHAELNSVGLLLHADAPPQVTQEGDDPVSGTDADRHDAISRNGSSWFGGNTDSAEMADLAGILINAQIAAGRGCPKRIIAHANHD
jgi:hypothetical protein